jgi:hypothetical protein
MELYLRACNKLINFEPIVFTPLSNNSIVLLARIKEIEVYYAIAKRLDTPQNVSREYF